MTTIESTPVGIESGAVLLEGELALPQEQGGVVVLAYDGRGGRQNGQHHATAERLRQRGLGTLVLNLRTSEEADGDAAPGRIDAELFGNRLVGVTDWLTQDDRTATRAVGFLGVEGGAAAALVAAASRPERVAAVVAQGGRPDLAGDALGGVSAPTLLIAAGGDDAAVEADRTALGHLTALSQMETIEGASPERAADLAADWFAGYLGSPVSPVDHPPATEKLEFPGLGGDQPEAESGGTVE